MVSSHARVAGTGVLPFAAYGMIDVPARLARFPRNAGADAEVRFGIAEATAYADGHN